MAEIEILIADSQTERKTRVAEALEAAGHGCVLAETGPIALDQALAHRPSVVVCENNLSMLDAVTLAEILRANPKTCEVRFLFLSGEPEGGLIGGIGDAALQPDCGAPEILDAVAGLLERQERVARIDGRADTQRDFSGVLSELCPAELLQLLHLRGAEGTLRLEPEDEGQGPQAGRIVIRAGEIDSATIGELSGEKALFRMLAWSSGCFAFEPGSVPGEPEMTTPTRSLLAEGLRQIDEWNRLAPSLPALDAPVRLRGATEDLPKILHPLTQEVLRLLDDHDRVSDVVDHCGYPDYQVLQTLHTLEERELIAFGHARVAPPNQLSGATVFSDAQARRLRTWAQNGLPRDAAVPDAKLLIVSASSVSVERFMRVLEKVPGAELSPRFERGEIGASDLELLARIDVDGDFGVDLIQLPSASSFAPLWPLAAHRGLGTILLLEPGVSESASQLAAVTETLVRRPGARTFHVVMLGEGERLSPEELRDNLSLIDEASLFLLPMASQKDPGSLLRTLFARIVP